MIREPQNTRSALPTSTLGPLPTAGGQPLGLRFVFPALRPLLVPGRAGSIVIGREAPGPAQLAGSELSRRHAELLCEGDQLVLRDLGSRNGVFVNAQCVPRAALRAHDVVRVGGWVAVVRPDEPDDVSTDGDLSAPGLHLGPSTQKLAIPARQLAQTGIPLVLEGASGTGKGHFAAAIHAWSGRQGPLVVVDCAAFPEPVGEGAGAGAGELIGYLRAARGGTLLLDEVTALPLALQATLVVALESGPVPLDVRIVAATQISLQRAVADKELRADLQARLDGYTLQISPLCERREDIPSLFVHLLERQGLPRARLSPRLVETLCRYDWPQNVRELDILAGRLAASYSSEPVLRRSHLPLRISSPSVVSGVGGRPVTRDVTPGPPAPSRTELLAALSRAGGNLARAAEALGISRPRAYRLLSGG